MTRGQTGAIGMMIRYSLFGTFSEWIPWARCFEEWFFYTKSKKTGARWHGNVFRLIGPLWWESTLHRWIPLTKGQLWGEFIFLCCWLEQNSEQIVELSVIWDAMMLMSHHCNGWSDFGKYYACKDVNILYLCQLSTTFHKHNLVSFLAYHISFCFNSFWVYPDSKVHGGQHEAHLGPTGPRWAPYWPHESCYLGCDAIWWHVDGAIWVTIGPGNNVEPLPEPMSTYHY